MNRLNGRVRKIEAEHPPADPGDVYTVADLAGDVIAAIADGWIVDWDDMPQDADFDFSSLQSPTVADGLDDATRSRAYGLMHQVKKLVVDFAGLTGWRSPAAAGDHREWKHWRCNSVSELAGVMGAILNETY